MTRTVQFPKKIFVVLEQPANDEPYLVVCEDMESAIEAAGHGGKVAVYDKLTVRTAEITRAFKE